MDVYRFRKRLGMNQKEFADFVGTRQATVSAWETGTAVPNPMAQKLLTLLVKEEERKKKEEEGAE